jgi:hypothetical protein
VLRAFSHPFSSGQTKSRPSDTCVGQAVAQALGLNFAFASGPSVEACGMAPQDPSPLNDQPWYEHCSHPFSSILPSCQRETKSYSANVCQFPQLCHKIGTRVKKATIKRNYYNEEEKLMHVQQFFNRAQQCLDKTTLK